MKSAPVALAPTRTFVLAAAFKTPKSHATFQDRPEVLRLNVGGGGELRKGERDFGCRGWGQGAGTTNALKKITQKKASENAVQRGGRGGWSKRKMKQIEGGVKNWKGEFEINERN